MNSLSMTYEELLRELNLDDPAELRRLTRYNHLPQLSRHKVVARETADNIVRILRGKEIDWSKYKAARRETESPGPLERKSTLDDANLVARWFAKIVPDDKYLDLQT